MSSPTATDRILHAVWDALERHRSELDVDEGLRSLELVVKIEQRSRTPRAVIVRRESERTLRS